MRKQKFIRRFLLVTVILAMAILLSGCDDFSKAMLRSFLSSVRNGDESSSYGESAGSREPEEYGESGAIIINIVNDPQDSSEDAGIESVVTIVGEYAQAETSVETSTAQPTDSGETMESEETASDKLWDDDYTLNFEIPPLADDDLEMPVEGATGYASVSLPLWSNLPGYESSISIQSAESESSYESEASISLQSNDTANSATLILRSVSGSSDTIFLNADYSSSPISETTQAYVGFGPGAPAEETVTSSDTSAQVQNPGPGSSPTVSETPGYTYTEPHVGPGYAMETESSTSEPETETTESSTESTAATTEADPYAGATAVLEPGTPFTILGESGNWWFVKTEDHTGWIESNYCLINLPDVIPSIIYNDTNSVSSIFKSSKKDIPGITGRQLYDCFEYNPRLGKNEYLMAVLYPMAKTIARAQHNALEEGNTLVIYESYRPHEVQMEVASGLTNLANQDAEVKTGVSTSPWSLGWFIARSMSNHQRGFAIDVSLAKVTGAEVRTNEYYSYVKVLSYEEYTMPTAMHELSMAAATFTTPVYNFSTTAWRDAELSDGVKNSRPALALQRYCTDAGLSPLASEWWHFNDLGAREKVINNQSTGGYYITSCMSISVAEARSYMSGD